nr:ABC transporter [Bacillota bacterium]
MQDRQEGESLNTVKKQVETVVAEQPRASFDDVWKEIEKEMAAITVARRRRKIISVLAKHGLLYLLKDHAFWKLFRKRRRSTQEDERLRQVGERLRLAFEELGPTFIKLGQVLVTRQDIIPDPITKELEKLLDQVPPIEFRKIQAIVDRELPEGLATFSHIEEKPLGSASLAQVYKVVMKDGRVAALKVVRPTVEYLFRTDITVIRKFVQRLQKRLPAELRAAVDLNMLIDNYYSSAMDELDMREEARKCIEMQKYRSMTEYVDVPEVYQATKNILLMEFIDGWHIKDFPVDFLTFEERTRIMIDLIHLYVQTMLDGHYYADAHGSNIIIDRHRKKAYIIDWGMTGRMDSILAQNLMRFIMHIQLNQIDDAVDILLEINTPTIYTDIVKVKDELKAFVLNYVDVYQGHKRYNYGRLVMDAIQIGLRNYCRVPSGLALWAKGFSATEGVARWLCPEISYGKVVEAYEIPILKSMLSKRFNYRANASLLVEASRLLTSFPRKANKILEHLADNNVRVNVQVQTDTVLRNTLNQLVNRLVLGLIVTAVVLSTGMVIASVPDGAFLGLSKTVIGNVGLLVSIACILFVVWRLFRTRKYRSLF